MKVRAAVLIAGLAAALLALHSPAAPAATAAAAATLAPTAAPAPAGPAIATAPTPAQIDSIGRLVTSFLAAQHVPGMSVAVVMNGRPVWSHGYGFADLENRVPATNSTVYRSASIGKTMTATAAMQLVEAGKLDLNADIRNYCSAFPAKKWKITPLNLLQHTSGIRHYGGPHDQEEQYSTIHYASVSDALAPFRDDTLQFQPGTKWLYSTYGYCVLGCVVEGAAGVPYLDYIKSHVWAPAGMSLTRDDDPAAIVPHRAQGYALENGVLRRAKVSDITNRLPAGGFITTVDDLAKFAAANLANRLVKAESFARMITPTRLPSGDTLSYGMGWGVETQPWHEDSYVYHGGSTAGVSGVLVIMPRHRFAVAILSNLEDIPGEKRGELSEDITRLLLGFEPRRK